MAHAANKVAVGGGNTALALGQNAHVAAQAGAAGGWPASQEFHLHFVWSYPCLLYTSVGDTGVTERMEYNMRQSVFFDKFIESTVNHLAFHRTAIACLLYTS